MVEMTGGGGERNDLVESISLLAATLEQHLAGKPVGRDYAGELVYRT
jgi:hypothetical protein